MRVIVVALEVPHNINSFFKLNDNDYIIAVDGALDSLLKQKIKPNLVIGDFDSVKNKKVLKDFEKITLKKEKDETDTFIAVKHAYSLCNNVIMIGGIKGDRVEHFIANLLLLNNFPNLIILNENTKIYLLKKGNHVITKSKYISIFAKEDLNITLSGFKYNLVNYNLNRFNPLGISNEIVNFYGEVLISSGEAIIFETK